ncbi:MAG: diguanylate cyclase [Wenzhouxiangella sp.]|jgi:diguanylate cyclase (GGDEF)-like protein|nr:diguanylate cyclase [Wenzhouxiangella sp.]
MGPKNFRTASTTVVALIALIIASTVAFATVLPPVRVQLLERAQEVRGSDPEAALQLLDRALTGLQPDDLNRDEIATMSDLLGLRAAIQRGRGRYEAASADAALLARLAEVSDDPGLAANAAFLQGSIEAEQGQFAAALDRFHAARHQLEDSDRPAELARILNAIGVTHNFIGDQERAREYFRSAVDMASAAGDAHLAGTSLGNLALSVAELEGPAAAVPKLREVLRLGEETGAQTMATIARANLCDQLVELNELEEAETTCLAALEEIDRMGEARWQAGIRLALGNLRKRNGRVQDAIDWYREALQISSTSVPTIEDDVLEALITALSDQGEATEALRLANRRIALRDQRRETERRELVEDLEVRYEVERSEADLRLLRLQSELQTAQIRQGNQLLIALLVVLSIALLAAAGAYRSYRAKASLQRDLAQRNKALEKALEQINDLARHDSLTGLFNRRALEELGEREVSRQQRQGGALSVMLMDIDYFKSINDRFGHAIGDEVLKGLAAILRQNFRDNDVVGRWGGEEFLCILPETDAAAAQTTARRIQSALATSPIKTSQGPISLTLTWGIAAVATSLDQAIRRADQAMYRGKHEGRDTIILAEAPSD